MGNRRLCQRLRPAVTTGLLWSYLPTTKRQIFRRVCARS
jgi:hypothetical protein